MSAELIGALLDKAILFFAGVGALFVAGKLPSEDRRKRFLKVCGVLLLIISTLLMGVEVFR